MTIVARISIDLVLSADVTLCPVSWKEIFILGHGRIVPVIMSRSFLSKFRGFKPMSEPYNNYVLYFRCVSNRKEDTSCLEDTPTKYVRNYNTLQPGEIYSLDHQCQLIHGNESVYCNQETDCKRLWCKIHSSRSNCHSSQLPWADGTPCNGGNYWCMKGECVSREGYLPQPVNGGWGAWSSWSSCSLSCGGGVQESQRECNNPLPKSGGKYCTGARKKYRSCNTQNCPAGSMDAREQQCYQMNGRHFGIKGISPDTKWIPKYGCK